MLNEISIAFVLVTICIILSISFKAYLLQAAWTEQLFLFQFMIVLLTMINFKGAMKI